MRSPLIQPIGGAGGGAGVTDHGALTGLTDPDHPASAITIATIGSPPADQVQEYLDAIGSVGFFTGGELSDAGGGSINVAAGQGFIRATSVDTDPLLSFAWSASAGAGLTSHGMR